MKDFLYICRIKNNRIELEEFDKSLSVNEIKKSLQESGYNAELISEIQDGLESSSVYAK